MNGSQLNQIMNIAQGQAQNKKLPVKTFYQLPDSLKAIRFDEEDSIVIAMYNLSLILSSLEIHRNDRVHRTTLSDKLNKHLKRVLQLDDPAGTLTMKLLMEHHKSLPNSKTTNELIEKLFEHSLPQSYCSLELEGVLSSIKKSTLPNKDKLMRIYIDHAKREYNKKNLSRYDLDSLSRAWEKNVQYFLSRDDLRWLKTCYEYPQSPVYHLKGGLIIAERQLNNSPNQLYKDMFYFTLISGIALFSTDFDKQANKEATALPASSEKDIKQYFIAGLYCLYLLSLPLRMVGSLMSACGMFKSQQPTPLVFPDWASRKLERLEGNKSAEGPRAP
ncbi:hypothetical protein [Legionella sp. 16cNR16C]|uniref:hypothetical protein n=1 Tax=Legionella sp. 16cNR16C TaxID=2905656 RepID=UPI001E36A526|nr:hypothetical protein [Legionella sp. 16cNR16C]MCE3043722.1 hypothetical protein [Legionella sp. 16cNR16C]